MKIESEKTSEMSQWQGDKYVTNYLDIVATFDEEEMVQVNKYIEFYNIINSFPEFCKKNNFPFATAKTDSEGKGPYEGLEVRYGWETWPPEENPIFDLLSENDDVDKDNVTITYKDPSGKELELPKPFYDFILTHEESWMHSWC